MVTRQLSSGQGRVGASIGLLKDVYIHGYTRPTNYNEVSLPTSMALRLIHVSIRPVVLG
jgi:hypothetical protein